METAELPSTVPRPSLAQWFASPFVTLLRSSHELDWNGVRMLGARLVEPPDFVPSPSTDFLNLVMLLEGSCRVEGITDSRRFQTQFARGALNLHPGRVELATRWNQTASVVFFQLPYTSVLRMGEFLQGDSEQVALDPSYGFYDPLLEHLLRTLYDEMDTGGLYGRLFAESVAQTIVLHLLRHHSNAVLVPAEQQAALTAAQRRLVEDFIETYLHEKVGLQELAALLHVSVPHFMRLFRAAFGRAPYEYLIERRIERAKNLIAFTTCTLNDVALECGFATQSHFTRHFTRRVGISPARYARAVRR